MTDKFLRGHRVKICDEMPSHMYHFRCGCEAIVEHGDYDGRYGLILLTEDGPSYAAWYDEGQLDLVSEDRDSGEAIIQKYRHS